MVTEIRLYPQPVGLVRAGLGQRAAVGGLYPVEAGTELPIGNGTFLHRDDFNNRLVTCGGPVGGDKSTE